MKKRNKFSLSHYKLLSASMGELLPIGLTEVLPGDTIQQATSVFMRLAPMVAPVMHPVHVKIHHWYVPLRLIWDEFEDFITGGPDGLNVSEFPIITTPSGGFPVGSLADYFGIPTGVAGLELSALPFRAYALIYNDWYRDQDLENPLDISTDSGSDTITSTALMHGDWERDYFTTARPWPQKGPEVTVPVDAPGGQLSVKISPQGAMQFSELNNPSNSGVLSTTNQITEGKNHLGLTSQQGTRQQAYLAGLTGSVTSSGSVGSININAIREASALQRFEEHRSMYGSRYTEYLRYLGVRSSDARLQRPEYLGGGRQTIQFSEVLQTAEGSDPVGTLRGHGIAAMRSNRYRRFIEEHGYIISMMHVRPKAIYMQGLPRTWNRRVKEDFFQIELQHIGQQEVLNKELYAAGNDPNGVFGYQNRYDEYREHESSVSGEFRSILNYWHMARDFTTQPVLNADFISSVPTNRIFASTTTDQLYIMANHSIQARRLLAKFGNPI